MSAVEYGIILGIVGIAGVAGITALRGSFDTSYDQTADAQGLVACEGVDPNCNAISELDPAQLPGAVAGAVQVSVLPATSVTATSAVLNGSVTPGGNTVTIDFCYQTSSDVTACVWVAGSPSAAAGGVPVDTSLAVSGLTAGATYNVWLRAVNGGVPTVGGPVPFTTVNSLPMVVLASAPSSVTTTTATLNGSVTANGSASNIQFCYQTGSNAASCSWSAATPSTATGASATPVALPVSGLSASTTYNVWVQATSSGSTVTSVPISFTTGDNDPVVDITAATPTGTTTATLSGTATSNGGTTTVTFCVQASSDMGLCSWAAASPSSVSGSTSTAVTRSLTGLTIGTTYNAWIRGVRSTTTVTDGPITFTTNSSSPTIDTDDVLDGDHGSTDEVTATSATLRGEVTANGSSVNVEFCVTTSSSNSGCAWQAASPPTASGTSGVAISYVATGLSPDTKYYFWARATRGATVVTSSRKDFTTDEAGPTISVSGATNIDDESATLNGSATANGSSRDVDFCVQTSSDRGDCTWRNATPSSVSGSGATAIRYSASNLDPNTTYYFWARIQGTSWVYAGPLTFTTPPQRPSADTSNPSSVTRTSATLRGQVDPNGASTDVWFCYQVSSSVGSCTWVPAEQSPISGSNNVNVSLAVTGLSRDTRYYFWVRATSAGGTDTSSQDSFDTDN